MGPLSMSRGRHLGNFYPLGRKIASTWESLTDLALDFRATPSDPPNLGLMEKKQKIHFQRGAQALAGSGSHEDGLARRPVSPELEPKG
ncbi:hypothetical protein L3X38_017384 [Prunus dulcis]|uniref:Uncharacterized protein n=1 Tax=Prunus dulcis TaxID=3755 RepID=A0AAD4W809_PRUDU|nr:hypothetical protein L3X38_017384 [Prunus dulcis]